MTYQALILGAGITTNTDESEFHKSRFLADGIKPLLEFSASSFHSASKVIVGLNPNDFNYFSGEPFDSRIKLISVLHPTQGALATAGMCLDLLVDDTPIIVAAIDGVCSKSIDSFYSAMSKGNVDGGVIVFPSDNLNYCYVRVNSDSPIEFAEKRKIGEFASAGIYYFKNKKLLEDSILWAMLNQVKLNNLFYFSSVMNKLVFENRKIVLFKIIEEEYFRFATEKEALASRKRLLG
jgi:dTDP-glucose pyrophosphorylase